MSALPLLVTPGDPAGIGPDILLKAHFSQPGLPVVAVCDPGLLEESRDRLGYACGISIWNPGAAPAPDALNCLPVMRRVRSQPGTLDTANSIYVLETLQRSVELLQAQQAAALVTGPLHKGIINDAGIPFSGHTEFLAEQSGTPQVVMMLAAPGLRVSLVTTHLPLRDVADAINSDKVEAVIRITHDSLQRQFGIRQPRLQVLGLNPHAGEGGHLGTEDDSVIAPVLEKLRNEGMDLEGPVPADTAFNPPRLSACDAVVAMYHDQGLPVLKHMGFGRAVNITLGLPFVRTSVDHGTALDLAGTGTADAGSLLEAIHCAQRMVGS